MEEKEKVKDLELGKSSLSCNLRAVVLILAGSVVLLCDKYIALYPYYSEVKFINNVIYLYT